MLLLSSALLPLLSHAATLSITSSSAEIDGDKQQAIHRGDVVLKQDDKELKADSVTLHRDKSGRIHKIEAKGAPATYSGTLSQNPSSIRGQASTILYYPGDDKLVLEGDAKLIQGEDRFEGPELTYEITKKRIASTPANNGRTTIVLQTR